MNNLHIFVYRLLACCNLILLAGLLAIAAAATPIADLPDALNSEYDFSWMLHAASRPSIPLVLFLERDRQRGLRMEMDGQTVCWEALGKTAIVRGQAPLLLVGDQPVRITLKRRPGTLALLCDHRLLAVIPMADNSSGTIAFGQLPNGITITDARYQPVELPYFGDDFMRPEALVDFLAHINDAWWDDASWICSFYHRDYPGAQPTDPKTGAALQNPWQLNFFPVAQTSANGFAFLYTGVGPSWVVSNPLLSRENWDRYQVSVAVRPDYQSAVGVMAAYQDNKNYLLFRCRPAGDAPGVLELLAVVDGETRVLAQRAAMLPPAQWVTLRLAVGWQHARAWVDETPVFDVVNPGSVEGRVGLYAESVACPRRPALDDATRNMYAATDPETGMARNEALEAVLETGYILFDDVTVRPWETIDELTSSPFCVTTTGRWTVTDDTLLALSPARWVSEGTGSSCYAFQGQSWRAASGTIGVLLNLDKQGNGYLWSISENDCCLRRYKNGKAGAVLAQATLAFPAEKWLDLRVTVDGGYLACYLNNECVLDYYETSLEPGACGVLASGKGTQFRAWSLLQLASPWCAFPVHAGFAEDKWLCTWASPEADWTPESDAISRTPQGNTREQVGAAAPYITNAPGRYWNKGSYYHDVRIMLPLSPEVIAGQILALADSRQTDGGYRLQLLKSDKSNSVKIWRDSTLLGEYPLLVTSRSRLLLERRGSLLIVRAQQYDPDAIDDDPEVSDEQLILVYRDTAPLKVTRVAFTVTTQELPAAAVIIDSDRAREAFERAPVGWLTPNGIWRIMARYACEPKWNWFGGFGAGRPAAWSKYHLAGDQSVEAYLGVKMKYLNATDEYEKRYRDLNLAICADGSDPMSGYSLLRASREQGKSVTLLCRGKQVIWRSTDPANLLPEGSTGHRQWFATRLEKHGADIQVYLDNRLATTFTDPDPLPGGQVAIWTQDNGIMIGRVNLSAEKMQLVAPGLLP